MTLLVVALSSALSVTVAACGGDGAVQRAAARATTPPPTRVVTTAAPATDTTAATVPATEVAVPAESSIASVRPEVTAPDLRDAAGGAPLGVGLTNPLPSGAPAAFLVQQQSVAAADGSIWHEVFIPARPNERRAWIADADVVLTRTDLAATVSLGGHRLELWQAGQVVATYPVAVGLPATPTPTGLFFVKELVELPSPTGAYGPIAFGLSAFSPTLADTEAFADGVIGIHGTNHPELIGTDASHGCIRMHNEDILDLERHQIPLGMPVRITP